jgi:hypothetical protein
MGSNTIRIILATPVALRLVRALLKSRIARNTIQKAANRPATRAAVSIRAVKTDSAESPRCPREGPKSLPSNVTAFITTDAKVALDKLVTSLGEKGSATDDA